MKSVFLALLALLALAFLALPAMANVSPATLVTPTGDGNYNINGLYYSGTSAPVQLFVPPAPGPSETNPGDSGLLWGQNNTSPIAYPIPGGPDYAPSPGGASGEGFDIEGVLWRYNPGNRELMVWVVSSIAPQDTANGFNGAPWGGSSYLLGDVFINTNGTGGYDYALISFGEDHPNEGYTPGWLGTDRNAGDLVSLNSGDTLIGTNGPASYGNPQAGLAYPWAVNAEGEDAGEAHIVDGNNTLRYEQITGETIEGLDARIVLPPPPDPHYGLAWNPATTTSPTYVSFFDVYFDVDLDTNILLNPNAWHVTVQCANDVGNGSGGPGGGGNVPVPGALILGIIGAGLVGLRRRMKA